MTDPLPVVADQFKCCPVEGLGKAVAMDQVILSGAERFVFRFAGFEIAIESFHELGGGLIRNAPQRGENRSCARILESAS